MEILIRTKFVKAPIDGADRTFFTKNYLKTVTAITDFVLTAITYKSNKKKRVCCYQFEYFAIATTKLDPKKKEISNENFAY